MLTLVPLERDLIAATVDELLRAVPDAPSEAVVVFPNQRQLLFLREELGRRFSGPFFPPRLLTIDALFAELFQLNCPGYAPAGELELAYRIWLSAGEVFPGGAYGVGAARAPGFCAYFPAARQLLQAVEEILVEGGGLPEGTDPRQYEVFAGLGDYHRDYKEFIAGLPGLTADFTARLQADRLCSRGLVHREVAARAEAGNLQVMPARAWLFAGLHALTRSEESLLRRLFASGTARLILHGDAASLHDPLSPFHLQLRTLAALGLEAPAAGGEKPSWKRFSGKVRFYPTAGVEAEMVQLASLLGQAAGGRDEPGLRRIGVVLPDPGSLIPFVQGVAARLDPRVPVNITLGYPLGRTPVYQLLEAMLRLRETAGAGSLRAGDYLALVRHPYVKGSAGAGAGQTLRAAIHRAEEILAERNLVSFRPEELEELLAAGPGPEGAARASALREVHRRFLIPQPIAAGDVVDQLRQVVAGLAGGGDTGHGLFLREYALAAGAALDEAAEFFAGHPQRAAETDFPSLAGLLRRHLDTRTIGFEGSPLRGVQVMGLLEFRGLGFDEVIVADAVEGVLPPSRKHDPLLPHDIRSLLGIRSHGDWERLYAHNFFSLLAGAGRVHLLVPGGAKSEPSRFIAKIRYEMEKEGAQVPEIRWRPFPLPARRREPVAAGKGPAALARLADLSLSPSALEDYIACPLRFQRRYILGLEERRALQEESDAAVRGTIVHAALNRVFSRPAGQ